MAGAFLAQSGIFDILRQIDAEMLGAVLILGVVGFFITVIVTVVTIARTRHSLGLMKMHHQMVRELLAKGYSVEEVERLAFGGLGWSQRWGQRLKSLVRSSKSGFEKISKRTRREFNRPAPPVKQSV